MRGDGTIYKRGEVWWMSYNVNGVRYAKSAETSVKEEARNRLRDEVARVRSGVSLPRSGAEPTFSALMDDLFAFYRMSSVPVARSAEYRWRLHLASQFGGMRPSQFGTGVQRAYREKRLGEGATNTTVNRELATLRRACHLAYDSEPPRIARIPRFELFSESGNARRVFITEADEIKIRQAAYKAGLWQFVYFEMAFLYGWRKGELLGLRAADVQGGNVRLRRSKNGDGREAPVPESLREPLTRLVANKAPEDRIFPREGAVHKHWERILAAAGLEAGRKGYIIHDIRRTAARNKRAAGIDTSIIMDLQGWRNEKMFRRYAIVDVQDKTRAFEKLPRYGVLPC
jgi:integrase